MPAFSEEPLLIAFIDLTRFAAQAERLPDSELAAVLDRYYELVGSSAIHAGGRVVKFIGDAALLAFPQEATDRAVRALLELKDSVDEFMADQRWECRLIEKVHFGSVVVGQFGSRAEKRYDVLGKTVNIAARLSTSGVALSVEAFRQLGPELRQRFKKHTPPVTYIRQEDSHRSPQALKR